MALPNRTKHLKVMPSGKLPDISLPPDWDKYAGDFSMFVNLENGDSVVTHTRRKVFNYPGFPKPVNTLTVPKYEVRDAPGKGHGVYATCDIYPGDLIWAERPFIVFSIAIIPPKGLRIGSHHTEGQEHALKLYAGERTVEGIINRLTPERKARFMSLANLYKEDGSGPCSGIVRTSQLEIRMVEGEPGPDPSKALRYTAVGDILSLTNHSCIPNIKNAFDFASFSLQTYSWAHIKKGDELVWSYIGIRETAAQRQKELSATAGVFMAALLKEDLDDPFRKKSPAKKEAKLKDYKNMIATLKNLVNESDSYGFEGQLYLLCLLYELYKRVGNETKRRRYVNLVVRWKKCEDIEFRPYI